MDICLRKQVWPDANHRHVTVHPLSRSSPGRYRSIHRHAPSLAEKKPLCPCEPGETRSRPVLGSFLQNGSRNLRVLRPNTKQRRSESRAAFLNLSAVQVATTSLCYDFMATAEMHSRIVPTCFKMEHRFPRGNFFRGFRNLRNSNPKWNESTIYRPRVWINTSLRILINSSGISVPRRWRVTEKLGYDEWNSNLCEFFNSL